MHPGSFVHAHLIEPKEQLWGRLIKINTAGVTMRAIDVKQIEVFKYQFKNEEHPVHPQTVFLPMRRIQKLDLDEPLGDVPSICDSVRKVTGMDIGEILPIGDRVSAIGFSGKERTSEA